jgi:hypothetical protein
MAVSGWALTDRMVWSLPLGYRSSRGEPGGSRTRHRDWETSMTPWRRKLLHIAQIFLIIDLAFVLGRFSESFSGSALAWSAVVLSTLGMVIISCIVVRDLWAFHER